jgi:uncharacterized membrane protein
MIVLASTLIAMAFLPDIIPVHFDIHGDVDRWGSKYELLIIPATLSLIWGIGEKSITFFVKRLGDSDDGKHKSDAANNEKILGRTLTITYAVMAVVNLSIIYMTFSNLDNSTLPEIDVIKIIIMLMGLMLFGLGNLMPKTRINSVIGFRLPWTSYNDNTWRKSNFFAGVTSMITGALFVIFGLIFDGFVAAIIMISLMLVSVVIITVYAYLVYRKEKSND